MKNPIMTVALVIVVAFLSIGAFSLSQKFSRSDSMMKKDESTMEKTTDEMGRVRELVRKLYQCFDNNFSEQELALGL